MNDESYFRSVGDTRRPIRRMLENPIIVTTDFYDHEDEAGRTPGDNYFDKHGFWPDYSNPLIMSNNVYYVIESVSLYLA